MRVKMTVAVAALAALALGLPASSYADRTVTVEPGESIQAAIDAADPGTTIEIEKGTYHESLLIKKDGIELEGSGRKSTRIVPPTNPNPGDGCVFEDPGPPPATIANGICVADVDEQFNVIHRVEDVEISNLSVTGFNGIGIFFVGADDGVVKRVIASDNGEYGIFANNSSGTVIARNVTGNDGEAGIYVGDSANADATVWKNVTYGSAFGVFIRDVANGEVLKNKSFGNCVGILFLNTPGPTDVRDWVAKDNDATANNKACPGGGDEPPFSGIGIAVVGGIDVHLVDNGAFGNRPDPTGSEVSGGIVVVEGSAGTRVESNTALGNDPFDLVWDGTGEGNRFVANDCLTSRPDGLCVDEDGDDDGDDDHGDDDDDHGDDDDDHDDDDRGEHRRKNGKGDRD
jgi:parallel beta helix pectate lyase-like protein